MRYPTLLACLLTTIAAAGAADGDLTVLEAGRDGGPPRAMLAKFLNAEASKAFDARRLAVAAIKTPGDLAARHRELRARFVEALGEFPEKTPLEPRTVGVDARDGYRVERVIYESRPDHHVTALFYIPDGPAPFPAVLVPCGHSANGKAAETYQRACILLARNGIAALCYDPIGQGERRQLLDGEGNPAGPGNTTEHTMVGIGAMLVGQSTAGYRVWDGIRSLDYLESRPEVDPKRLGCTGNSGGGTLTAYLMALDDRVLAAAPSCYITSLERLFATIGPQDAEQNITGQVAFGLEHADFLGLRAPRPTLILCSTRDYFDIQGAWTSFREAKRTFGLLGHPERVDIAEANESHGFTKPHREAMVRWMRRWLLAKDDAPVEGDLTIAGDADLLCTKSGQVLADFRGKSVFDFNAERETKLARRRSEVGKTRGRDALLADVRRLIALREPIGPATGEDRRQVDSGGATVRKLVFKTEPGIEVPARLFTTGKVVADRPLAVAVGHDSAGAIKGLLDGGQRVLMVDLRGMGETAPAAKNPGPLGVGVPEAFLALHLARPLLGQRVGDLLAVLAAMADESPRGFDLIGRGNAGPIALHAAALEPRVVALTLENTITSWSDVVRTPLSRDQLANVVPGALAAYDLPDLAATLAPRPLNVRGAVDPAGQPLSREQIVAAYAAVLEAYRGRGAEGSLAVDVSPPR